MSDAPATRKELQRLSRDQLRDLARQRKLRGFGSMRKPELVQALLGEDSSRDPLDSARKTPLALLRVGPPRLPTDSVADVDQLEAEAVDPHWLHVRWSLTSRTLQRAVLAMGADWHRARPVLRIFRVTCDESGPRSKSFLQDLPIAGDAVQWFVNLPAPATTWQLELGYSGGSDHFFPLLHSQPVTLPSASASAATDHKPKAETPLARDFQPWDSPALISVKLCAEVILSGTTVPQATVTIDDEQVAVSPDGAFRWSGQLPDGRTVIPAEVECADFARQRILIVIERNTRPLEPELIE